MTLFIKIIYYLHSFSKAFFCKTNFFKNFNFKKYLLNKTFMKINLFSFNIS